MRWRWGVLAGVLAALAITVSAGAVTQAQGRRNHALATAAAAQLAGEAVLPADATPLATAPAGQPNLAHPLTLYPYLASVDRHAFYVTSTSPDAVVASVAAHLPAGARRNGYGHGGTLGQPDSIAFADWTVPAPGGWSPGRPDLSVAAMTLKGGRTGVRIDADVRYRAPHPPSALIPDGARSVKVTLTPGYGGASRSPLRAELITSRVKVRRLAALIDGLPLLASFRGEAFSCPALTVAPTVTITFRDAAGRDVATVSEPANTLDTLGPCFAVSFTVRGRQQPGLMDGRTLLRRAGAIVGVRLVRRG